MLASVCVLAYFQEQKESHILGSSWMLCSFARSNVGKGFGHSFQTGYMLLPDLCARVASVCV